MASLIVVTGASRGLGAALARMTAGPDTQQLLIARSSSELADVKNACEAKGSTVTAVSADLADPESATRAAGALSDLKWDHVAEATLFNNASTVLPIKRLESLSAAEIDHVIRLNLGAAFVLTSKFIGHLAQAQSVQGEVFNVSTGVSLNPLVGWSLYCCSKAGLNLLAASVAQETLHWPRPVRAVSLNPGPIDTEMQREIRETPDDFPDRARFVNLHREHLLATADEAAGRILLLRKEDPFPQGQFVDLRNR